MGECHAFLSLVPPCIGEGVTEGADQEGPEHGWQEGNQGEQWPY